MLIYFFSDRNYIRQGFYAKYNITPCAFNCHGRGQCDNVTHTCSCQSGYAGESCQLATCPDLCNGHGNCDFAMQKCQCEEGYAGFDCRLAMFNGEGGSTWYTVAPEGMGFQARTGHAGVFVKAANSLYIFGGNSLNVVFNELVRYSFTRNKWEVLPQTAPWPSARHGHAMAGYGDRIYMYGGTLQNGSHSNQLWMFDTTSETWSLKAQNSIIQPKPLASHTLTLVDDRWMYLFGGRTDLGEYVSDMHRVAIEDDTQWELVIPLGGKPANRRLVGHTTVYHKESRSLLVFGGFLPDYARFPKRTNALHSYHIDQNYWSRIHFNRLDTTDPPKDRAFHSAAILGNYMVIYGGNSHIHHDEEVCYDSEIYFYHLGCHRWVHYKSMEQAFPGKHIVVYILLFACCTVSTGHKKKIGMCKLTYSVKMQ